jgi:GTP cyclohydrolase I
MNPQRQTEAVIEAAWEQYMAAMGVSDARDGLERATQRLVRAKRLLAELTGADAELNEARVSAILDGGGS